MNISTQSAQAASFAASRLASFSKGDIEALIAQYAPDATVVTPNGVLHGREQIRPMIEGIIGEFGQPGVAFNLLGQNAEGPIVAFRWTAETPRNSYGLGAETYVLNEAGLAQYQTFASQAQAK
jgi:ketosteroid isomerase-like protein